jgi:hypothetical protein
MAFRVRKRRFAVIMRLGACAAMLVLAALFSIGSGVTGCSGGGGGGTTASGVGAEAGTEVSNILAEMEAQDFPTVDYLQYVYADSPQSALTLYDIIKKRQHAGLITAEEALKLELCHYYGAPCLPDE